MRKSIIYIVTPTGKPRSNKTVAVNGWYTSVNHKVTIVNGQYLAHFVSTMLRPFFLTHRIRPETAKTARKSSI